MNKTKEKISSTLWATPSKLVNLLEFKIMLMILKFIM